MGCCDVSCCKPETSREEPRPAPEAGLVEVAAAPPVEVRRARGAAERAAAEGLLRAACLPLGGLDDALLFVAVAAGSGRVVGCAGLEVWGRSGLLRSLAVDARRRGAGVGRALVAAVEALARELELAEVALLTTGAAPFFERLGYVSAGRERAPRALSASAEWSEEVCPSSAGFLVKELRPPAQAPPAGAEEVHDLVRRSYARAAERAGSCCPAGPELLYDPEALRSLPAAARMSLGCGTPLDLARPRPGETVLDLGSGGGLDALLAARAVGERGRVIGVDMTPEMVARARRAAAASGFAQVEFREGLIERLPVEDGSVDVVVSNCVINLSPDQAAVFREAFRVLRPGGRLVVSDIVSEGELPAEVRSDPESLCACVGGAAPRDLYLERVRAAGFHRVEVLREVAYPGPDGVRLRSITVQAGKT